MGACAWRFGSAPFSAARTFLADDFFVSSDTQNLVASCLMGAKLHSLSVSKSIAMLLQRSLKGPSPTMASCALC